MDVCLYKRFVNKTTTKQNNFLLLKKVQIKNVVTVAKRRVLLYATKRRLMLSYIAGFQDIKTWVELCLALVVLHLLRRSPTIIHRHLPAKQWRRCQQYRWQANRQTDICKSTKYTTK